MYTIYKTNCLKRFWEEKFLLSAVTKIWLTLYFGVFQSFLSFRFSKSIDSFLFTEASTGVFLNVDCTGLFYFIVTIWKNSIPVASFYSKTCSEIKIVSGFFESFQKYCSFGCTYRLPFDRVSVQEVSGDFFAKSFPSSVSFNYGFVHFIQWAEDSFTVCRFLNY